MKREVFVEAAKGSDEVTFESADCPFGGVAAMSAGGNDLEVDGLVVHVFFEDRRAFVV